MFAIDNMSSFEHVETYRRQNQRVKDADDFSMLLVGNKIDLTRRDVDQKLAFQYATAHNMHYVETSAKTRRGVEDAFYSLVREIRRRKEVKMTRPPPRARIRITNATCSK